MERCCLNCKYYDNSWGSSCLNPKFQTFDKVEGVKHPTPRKVIGRCDLIYWELKVDKIGEYASLSLLLFIVCLVLYMLYLMIY